MKRILTLAAAGLIGLSLSFGAQAQDTSGFGDDMLATLREKLQENADKICAKLDKLPTDICVALIEGGDVKSKLTDPATLNTALDTVWGANPLNLSFKVFQVEGKKDSLGFSYEKDFEIKRVPLDETNRWNRSLELDLKASGNVAFEQAANPNDFLNTKLSLAHSWSTNIFGISRETGKAVQDALALLAKCEVGEAGKCAEADTFVEDAFEKDLSGFTYFKVGLEAGYESDQAFKVTQTAFSAYVYGQTEDWGNRTLLGKLGLFPALRLGLDRINPDAETPRSMLGDTSDFYRFSGEASVSMPIATIEDMPLRFTANYRYYHELAASDVVKAAGLDDFNLLTLSIAGPKGVYVSYSTGELPLDADRSNTVEIGWKLHF